ncbi:MAG: response regulator, partial [Acetobacteraceae bacterium]
KIVLVAEDQMLVRMEAADALTLQGYEVMEVDGADDALAVLEARAADIGVLFTDIQMPGSMDGLALAHHARRNWPWIGLLIASGKERPSSTEMPAGCRFLSKAYDPDHMVDQVRELIAAH